MKARKRRCVSAYHETAVQIGETILDSGGNAFDAFVASTAATYVLGEGTTSLAGCLGALTYSARTRTVEYLDADFNEPKTRKRWWRRSSPPGNTVPVPGAVAGLEALSRKYGRFSFADALAPAIALARTGFRISKYYASVISARAPVLQRSDYGRGTFFPEERPLREGDVLRQPEVADFLTNVARYGAEYMYNGPWGRQFVETVRGRGGLIKNDDLSAYTVEWPQPWTISYRGHKVYACSGFTFGGLWTLVALKTLENIAPPFPEHFSTAPHMLEVLVRLARQVDSEAWLFNYKQLANREYVQSRLAPEYVAHIWGRVQASACGDSTRSGTAHSYHVIAVDHEGNAVTGTNTIESAPWADGIFVQGIPLSNALKIPYGTRPGKRRLNLLSMHLVLRDGALRFATGAFASSLIEASFQFLVNLIDYRLSPAEAARLPRFGTIPFELNSDGDIVWCDTSRNWLDKRVNPEVVTTLESRGLLFHQEHIDTGLGNIVVVNEDGTLQSATTPLQHSEFTPANMSEN